MSNKRMKAVQELSRKLDIARIHPRWEQSELIAIAIVECIEDALGIEKSRPQGPLSSVDQALGIGKSPARDPDDVDMGR
jgi:hypothetical protein